MADKDNKNSRKIDESGARIEYGSRLVFQPEIEKRYKFESEEDRRAQIEDKSDSNIYIGRVDGKEEKKGPRTRLDKIGGELFGEGFRFKDGIGAIDPSDYYYQQNPAQNFYHPSNPFNNFTVEEDYAREKRVHEKCGGQHCGEYTAMTYYFKKDEFLEGNFSSCCVRDKEKYGEDKCSGNFDVDVEGNSAIDGDRIFKEFPQ